MDGATTIASYPGPCPRCDAPIVRGEPITLIAHQWVCSTCAQKTRNALVSYSA